MSWKDLETKAGTAIAGEKKTVLTWIGAHKGWLVTTAVSHALGWVGLAVVKHIL